MDKYLTRKEIAEQNYDNIRKENTEFIFKSDFLEKIRRYRKSELNPFFITDIDNKINIHYNNPNGVLIRLTTISYNERSCFGRDFRTNTKEILLQMFLKKLGEEI